jgi:hypothetical protein
MEGVRAALNVHRLPSGDVDIVGVAGSARAASWSRARNQQAMGFVITFAVSAGVAAA